MSKAERQICTTCGRPLPPKTSKRGRPKLYHRECVVFESRLRELVAALDLMHFAPPVRKKGSSAMLGHAKEVRSGLHEVWKNFTVTTVKCSEADTEFFYVEQAKRK